MITTALANPAEYKHSMEARFVTKPDKVTPLHCTTCDAVLVMGQAAAAVTPDGRWDSYCAECAEHPAAQVRALLGRITALGVAIDAATTDLVKAYLTAEGAAIRPTFLAAKLALMATLDGKVRADRVEALQDNPVWVGLALATTPGLLIEKDRSFAESLATQWEQQGFLSEVARNGGPGQMHYAEKLAAKARKADAKGNVAKPWTAEISAAIEAAGLLDGYYAVDYSGTVEHQDTTFVRVLTADDGARFLRHIVGGKGETPSGGKAWCERVVALIVADGIEASMRRYGREIERCCKCHRTLTDKPSRDAGIGPVWR